MTFFLFVFVERSWAKVKNLQIQSRNGVVRNASSMKHCKQGERHESHKSECALNKETQEEDKERIYI